MFGSSTQLQSWTFKDEKEITALRREANASYISKYDPVYSAPEEEKSSLFLTAEEEHKLVRYYEQSMREFCRRFKDPRDGRIRMPAYVTTTAQHYFKRFYLYNSVMDHHPKDILVTCVYLSCKIEEFYVTINDFVYNVKGDKKKAAEIILNNELQLTQELQFHLIIHQPFRPVEGIIIDIKTRYSKIDDPDKLRPHIEEFLDKVHLTDAIILYSPSQIAVAAVTTAVSKIRENLDSYVTDILFKDHPNELAVLIEAVRKIKKMVKTYEAPPKEPERKILEVKLENCRNPKNNPNSSEYRGNYTEWDGDLDMGSQAMEVDPATLGIERIKSPSSY